MDRGAKEGQARIITPEQEAHIIETIKQGRHATRNLAIFLLTRKSGMRIGTVAGLLLSDILDADNSLKTIVVGRRNIMKGRKTAKLFLQNALLRETLEKWLLERPDSKKTEALFVSQKGVAFTPNGLSKLMLKIYERAGLEGYSSHSGRRSYATECIQKGADIVALKTLLNHSNIETTSRYVTHNDDYLLNLVADI